MHWHARRCLSRVAAVNCDWHQDGVGAKGRNVFRCRRPDCPNALYAAAASDCHATCRGAGLGNWVAARLASIGVTSASYRRWKVRCGLVDECKCDKRKEKLNRFGWMVAKPMRRAFAWLRSWRQSPQPPA